MACATALPMGAHAADNILRDAQPSPFKFGYLAQCISLGRHDALLQFVHADDRPRRLFLSGRLAAFVKEMICYLALKVLFMERRYPGLYTWPRVPLGKGTTPADGTIRAEGV
jgi:NADH dehydrogenase FAD-containing subunit